MGINGNLTTMSVSDLLQFLASGRKTGTLKFDRGKVVKQIYMHNGLIVGSNSNDPNEYFGQLLIHYGKLDEAQLQAAMEVQRNAGGKLGEILISTKVLSEADVVEILRIRTLDVIYDLFLWEEAHFEFFDYDPLPKDLIRIEVEPTAVIMDGIYRIDEWARYRTMIPSDRVVLKLGPGWTSSLNFGKEVRQILYFIEKGISVAEICYNMHASAFHVYGQIYDLVSKGIALVAGELAESFDSSKDLPDLPETIPELLGAVRSRLSSNDAEAALSMVHKVLETEPKNAEAESLLLVAEKNFIQQMYAAHVSPTSIPKLLVAVDSLTEQQLGPEEGFLLSRINGEWDIGSILSICPFREADSLRMIKKLLDSGIIGL
jgi:hypothetical protein